MSTLVKRTTEQRLGRLLAAGTVAAMLLSASHTASGAEPVPGATVNELLARVRNLNPELAAAALEREAAVAKIYPAGALDDPMVNLSRDQGFRQTLFSVSQEFPLWGKRDLRKAVAEANAEVAAGRRNSLGLELEEQMKVAFAQYYQMDQAIRVTREIHSLLHTVAESVRSRYAQGVGSQSDAIRADLEQTRLGPELSALERDEEIAKAKINALIGRSANAPLAKPQVLRRLPSAASLKLDALVARSRSGNPMVSMALAEIAAAEGERTLVDKSWYPDVTLSLGADDLPNMGPRVTAGVGIKVPLQWGVREAEARAATAKKGAAQLRLDAAILKIESELQSALATLLRARATEDLLKHGLSQQSEAAYQSALASYQQGRGDLTPVLDTAHSRLQIRVEILRVETEAQTALAAIERQIGSDL
jgi:cobalt-zinc-cadmium efflux system outer membrane protein